MNQHNNLEQPTPIEQLPADTRKIAVRATGLREQNTKIIAEIERMGGALDLANARVEHMLTSLFALGVITEMQMWQIAEDWEVSLRDQLKTIRSRMQEKLAGARKNYKPQLIIPNQPRVEEN